MTDQTSADDVAREIGEHPGYKIALKIIEDWPIDGREYTKERWLADLINTLCRNQTAALQAERARVIGECLEVVLRPITEGYADVGIYRQSREDAANGIRAIASAGTAGDAGRMK